MLACTSPQEYSSLMAKRNRHREILKHGSLQGVRPSFEMMRAPVSDADKQLFGRLVLWTHKYVNHVYEHAGHDGKPQEKRVSEPLYWHHIHESPRIGRIPLTVSAAGRVSVALGMDYLQNYEEHARQRRLGNVILVELKDFPENASRNTFEAVRFETDADGMMAGGRYVWIGDTDQERPAPDADFSSVQEAHEATVTGRAAYLLWQFRNLVIHTPEQLRLRGAWGWDVQVSPPAELVPIPEIG
jgi:hypothetical protein